MPETPQPQATLAGELSELFKLDDLLPTGTHTEVRYRGRVKICCDLHCKVVYETRERAEQAAHTITRKGTPFGWYYAKDCRFYHVYTKRR